MTAGSGPRGRLRGPDFLTRFICHQLLFWNTPRDQKVSSLRTKRPSEQPVPRRSRQCSAAPPVWPVRSEPRAGAGRLSDSQDPGEAGSPGACIYCLPRNHTQHSFNLSSCPSAPERPDGLKLPHRALLLSTYLITFIYLSSVNSSANSGAPGGPSSGVYLAALSPGAGCGVRPQRLLSCWGRWMEAVSPFPVHRESLPNACSMRDAGKCCEILLSIFYFRFYSQP